VDSRPLRRARHHRHRDDPHGDYLLGDRDGVVIIPQPIAEEAIVKTEEVVATESDMRRALIGGMDPVEAYNRYGKF
jgi:regulator of RNase E activity RraA